MSGHMSLMTMKMKERLVLLLKAVVGLVALGCLTSCGSSMEARNGALANFSSTSVSGGSGAECNTFSAQGVGLAGGVTTYYANNTLQDNILRLRISSLDSGFTNSTTQYLQFFRWKAAADGTVTIDQTALTFYVARLSDGAVISNAITSISNNDVINLRSTGSIPGTTAQEFFSNTVIVLTNVDYTWNAAKIVLYDGTTTKSQADVLLPIFPANPNAYATSHPAVLNQLHPFMSIRTQNLSDSDWVAKSRSFCF